MTKKLLSAGNRDVIVSDVMLLLVPCHIYLKKKISGSEQLYKMFTKGLNIMSLSFPFSQSHILHNRVNNGIMFLIAVIGIKSTCSLFL